MKLTEWYAGNQKPARVGVYQRKYGVGVFYCYWNGKTWGLGFKENNQTTLLVSKQWASKLYNLKWRGIAK